MDAFCGGAGGSWRVLGGPLEGAGSSPEGIWGSKTAREPGQEDNKEEKNNYILKRSKLPINRLSGAILKNQDKWT